MVYDWSQHGTSKIQKAPPIIIIYGVGGIGKTTLASKFPKPMIIPVEQGAGQIAGVFKLPQPKSTQDLESMLEWAAHGEHDYTTCIIDSLDKIQELKSQEIAVANGVEDAKQIAYGQGAAQLRGYFNRLTKLFDEVRSRGMIVICIAHSVVGTHKDPMGDDYSFYNMNLDEKIGPSLHDWSDICLFINNKVITKEASKKFGQSVIKAVSKGDHPTRIIFTEKRPGFLAKNRYGMPPQIELYEGDPKATADEILNHVRAHLRGEEGMPEKTEANPEVKPDKIIQNGAVVEVVSPAPDAA